MTRQPFEAPWREGRQAGRQAGRGGGAVIGDGRCGRDGGRGEGFEPRDLRGAVVVRCWRWIATRGVDATKESRLARPCVEAARHTPSARGEVCLSGRAAFSGPGMSVRGRGCCDDCSWLEGGRDEADPDALWCRKPAAGSCPATFRQVEATPRALSFPVGRFRETRDGRSSSRVLGFRHGGRVRSRPPGRC